MHICISNRMFASVFSIFENFMLIKLIVDILQDYPSQMLKYLEVYDSFQLKISLKYFSRKMFIAFLSSNSI